MTTRLPIELVNTRNQRVGNKILLVNSDNEPLQTDREFNSLVFVELEHNRIRRGVTFRSWYVVPHDTPLANDGEINIVITTTTKDLHIVFSVAGGGDFEFYIYRSPNVGAGGSALPIHNLNDSSAVASTVTVVLNPTINDDGTEIDGEFTQAEPAAGLSAGQFAAPPRTTLSRIHHIWSESPTGQGRRSSLE